MARTLHEFYDNLSESAQEWIRKECRAWFDENQPDYQRKFVPVTKDAKDILFHKSEPKSTGWHSYYSNSDKQRDLENMYISELVHKRDELKIISDEDVRDAIIDFIQKVEGDAEGGVKLAFACNEQANQRLAYSAILSTLYSKGKYPLGIKLFFVDDFDRLNEDIDFNEIDFDTVDRDEFTILCEIFGSKCLEKLANENMITFARNYRKIKELIKSDKRCELQVVDLYVAMRKIFDRKFFVDNSWTDESKREIIKEMYQNSYPDTALRRFEMFVEDIISVDSRYMKYIYDLVDYYPALGNHIYEAKKPEDEINPNDPVDMTYRYSKDIRKLGRIANICTRKSLSKANNGFLKDIGSIIRLVGYNFNAIYEMMYPNED